MSGHIPVLLNEVIQALKEQTLPVRSLFEGTFGRGGHTEALFKNFEGIRIVAFDRDSDAIESGKKKFSKEIEFGRLNLVRDDYRNLLRHELGNFDAAFLDLGISSPQIDEAQRGFSFMQDGPLDMRMDRGQDLTAAEVINSYDEKDLIEIFQNIGEVRKPFRVVRALVHDRKTKPFQTTRQLASLIERVEGFTRRHHHPATNYFMALRIVVNRELENLEPMLENLTQTVNDGGRILVITFHSIEDRIIKNAFKSLHHKVGHIVNKKVITPSREEIKMNPRSRSAKLRVFEVNHKRSHA
ncbi:MAG: 16S rRNA (cytosine(1402)-N(4))-methyltransferase RsmH [Oligoflexia bacterium]|nr:16S rRNA (cytosine(1402)-N(4))-methyltransferase RsmH [Oligoflexia bacterium]